MAQQTKTRMKLAVVDDEPQICSLVARVGKMAGFETRTHTSAEDFLAALPEFNPDVLVVDLRMPTTDGIKLLQDVKSRCEDARVIVISGADKRVLRAVETLGGPGGINLSAVLQKPLGIDTLRAELEKAGGAEGPLRADELESAIEAGQLVVHYQPKISWGADRNMAVTGVEALVRWQHPVHGLLPPNRFLPLAEEAGLMDVLTECVLRTALTQVSAWKRSGIKLTMAINASTSVIQDDRFPDRLAAHLRECGVDGRDVTLEITEAAAMADPAMAKEVCLRLRVTSVGISMDDFGTGFSSMKQLYELPFSELKVDRQFVADVPREEEAKTIVVASIDLAHALGMTVCAEGVETKAALGYLERLGCDSVQGFLISRPVPAEQIAAFVKGWGGSGAADRLAMSTVSTGPAP